MVPFLSRRGRLPVGFFSPGSVPDGGMANHRFSRSHPSFPPFTIRLTGVLALMRRYAGGFPARLLAGGRMTKRFKLQKPTSLKSIANWFCPIDSTVAGSKTCFFEIPNAPSYGEQGQPKLGGSVLLGASALTPISVQKDLRVGAMTPQPAGKVQNSKAGKTVLASRKFGASGGKPNPEASKAWTRTRCSSFFGLGT